MAPAAAGDGDRAGGYAADHPDRMGHGPGVEWRAEAYLFFILNRE